MPAKPPSDPDDPDAHLFREAMRGVAPLPQGIRVEPLPPRHPPIPEQTLLAERQALADSLADTVPWDVGLDTGEELVYLRPGLAPEVLRKLRRGKWIIQDEIDLHGMRSVEAGEALTAFMSACGRRGLRCIRIIHGKGLGSKNREPVLKRKVGAWLMRRGDVLAFAQARQADGGSGAVVVLLKPAPGRSSGK